VVDRNQRPPAPRALDAEPGARRASVRWRIIGRLLLDGGTVEQPAPRSTLTLELSTLRTPRARKRTR
jgi:hypothetical protein